MKAVRIERGKKKMASEKLTVKKIVVIVVLGAILGLGGYALFFAIALFTSPLLHPVLSFTLALSVVLVPCIAVLIQMLKKRKKAGN